MDRKNEFKKGMRRTGRYVLSHHLPDQYHKCYSIRILGKRLHICARCTGVYIGILSAAFVSFFTQLIQANPYLFVVVFPVFALMDWSLTSFTGWRGRNLIRTVTGIFLGFGYISGLVLLFTTQDWPVSLASAVMYGCVAGILILLRL
ncbi:MAG: DUF2085 domain-containing protein [Halobacteria archaeon]